MAVSWVYKCDGTRGESVVLGTETPTCNPAAQGAWVQVELVAPGTVIPPAIVNAAEAAEAFGAGFIVVAFGMMVGGAIAFVVRSVRDMW